MPSVADIVNQGLSRIGNTAFIDALTDATTEAAVATLQYDSNLRELLSARDWPFATRRAQLADTGTSRNGWRHVYAAPADLVKPLAIPYPTAGTGLNAVSGAGILVDPLLFAGTPYVGIWTAYRNLRSDQRIPFRVERGDQGGKVILCDYDSPELIYVGTVDDPNELPPLVVNALGWALAEEFAYAIQKEPQLGRVCKAEYEAALAEAYAAELNGMREDREPDSLILAARR